MNFITHFAALSQADTMALFREGQTRLLVATDMAARGLDVPEVGCFGPVSGYAGYSKRSDDECWKFQLLLDFLILCNFQPSLETRCRWCRRCGGVASKSDPVAVRITLVLVSVDRAHLDQVVPISFDWVIKYLIVSVSCQAIRVCASKVLSLFVSAIA